jgi:hypothetical protein
VNKINKVLVKFFNNYIFRPRLPFYCLFQYEFAWFNIWKYYVFEKPKSNSKNMGAVTVWIEAQVRYGPQAAQEIWWLIASAIAVTALIHNW